MRRWSSATLAIVPGGPPFSFVDPDHALAGAVARFSELAVRDEIHYLARMFKRDLYEPVSFARGLERMKELGAVLRPAGREKRP